MHTVFPLRTREVVLTLASAILWAACSSSVPGKVGSTGPASTPAPSAQAPIGTLEAGQTYHQADFSEPLQFTLPAFGSSEVIGDVFDANSFRLRIAGTGAITIHDDVPLPNDLCHSTVLLDDVPATLDAVGTWLTSSEGLTVSPAREITTADQAAGRYWDVRLEVGCAEEGWPKAAAVSFESGESHRVYAVSARNDVILIFTWGTGYGGEGEERLDALNLATDELVHSIHFD